MRTTCRVFLVLAVDSIVRRSMLTCLAMSQNCCGSACTSQGKSAIRDQNLVIVVKVADGDARHEHAALDGALPDGAPLDLQRLVAQLRLQADHRVDPRLVRQSVLHAFVDARFRPLACLQVLSRGLRQSAHQVRWAAGA